MKIGDRVFVHGYIDEIRKDTIIIRNNGGYFGTVPSEVMVGALPSAQPETHDKRTETHACDLIDRQKVRYKLTALVNELEEIFAHIRERNVDDSVCGLCEYDGAYMGQSGDWCNECPGFDMDDCFKLKEKYREEWLKIDG